MEKEYAPSANEKKMNVPAKAKSTSTPVKPVVKDKPTTTQTPDNNVNKKADNKVESKTEAPQTSDNKVDTNVAVDNKAEETKQTSNNKADKVQDKKKAPIVSKKDEAIANGRDMPASKRHCIYIGRFIKNKPIDVAIRDLELVMKFKKAVPMKGEIPHRKGDIMSGRYPIKVAQQFIAILKGLKGNVVVNGMDLDKTRITYVSANWAPRPMKGGGARFKRSHVIIKAREVEYKGNKEKKK